MTTTPVPTCTDDLLAEIERVTDPDAIHMIAHSDMDALLARLHAAEKDAGRYRWLTDLMIGVDFDWQDSGETVLCFKMPDDSRFGADCDKNIDAAMEASK